MGDHETALKTPFTTQHHLLHLCANITEFSASLDSLSIAGTEVCLQSRNCSSQPSKERGYVFLML